MRHRFIICFLISVLLTALACKQQTVLSGEVFVVTAGRENVKLALVEIKAIPEEEINAYLKARYTEIKGYPVPSPNAVEKYFSGLPSGTATAMTNADGKFTITLPKGRFVLAAQSFRRVFDSTENYYWLVWVKSDGRQPPPLILSNHNLVPTPWPANLELPIQ
jgi:hypothetical protein